MPTSNKFNIILNSDPEAAAANSQIFIIIKGEHIFLTARIAVILAI